MQEAAFSAWIDSLPESFWDDAADACGILDTMQAAFEAGYEKCLEDHP